MEVEQLKRENEKLRNLVNTQKGKIRDWKNRALQAEEKGKSDGCGHEPKAPLDPPPLLEETARSKDEKDLAAIEDDPNKFKAETAKSQDESKLAAIEDDLMCEKP